ncbi:MAG: cell division protein FtsB [Deltaproteobacteria bacterium]|nr:septum formation initiator family protein [Deltaproteobacteria bacterium]MBW2077279.1 septum formation initiator family protein [Deltaproteobacteria bacterium]MBW2309715.1 septum formation initiator family protein [Deltaproteobacteria bacterium]RLB28734.1 MAG: cell division protein FtsB [Deltaproteobacteria bacterium]
MRKKYVAYGLILCLVAGLLFAWLSFAQNGLVDLLNMQSEKEKNLTALKDLREKNKLLAYEIRRLREDPKFFESVARRELGLVRENEIVFRVKEDKRGTITRPIQGNRNRGKRIYR